jgi:hypothetical protein
VRLAFSLNWCGNSEYSSETSRTSIRIYACGTPCRQRHHRHLDGVAITRRADSEGGGEADELRVAVAAVGLGGRELRKCQRTFAGGVYKCDGIAAVPYLDHGSVTLPGTTRGLQPNGG